MIMNLVMQNFTVIIIALSSSISELIDAPKNVGGISSVEMYSCEDWILNNGYNNYNLAENEEKAKTRQKNIDKFKNIWVVAYSKVVLSSTPMYPSELCQKFNKSKDDIMVNMTADGTVMTCPNWIYTYGYGSSESKNFRMATNYRKDFLYVYMASCAAEYTNYLFDKNAEITAEYYCHEILKIDEGSVIKFDSCYLSH